MQLPVRRDFGELSRAEPRPPEFTQGGLEILIDESGRRKVAGTVEYDQAYQDSDVVNRQGHESGPRSRASFAQQDTILTTLLSRAHGLPFLQWRVGSGLDRDIL